MVVWQRSDSALNGTHALWVKEDFVVNSLGPRCIIPVNPCVEMVTARGVHEREGFRRRVRSKELILLWIFKEIFGRVSLSRVHDTGSVNLSAQVRIWQVPSLLPRTTTRGLDSWSKFGMIIRVWGVNKRCLMRCYLWRFYTLLAEF